jgi:hypothetical protein
MMGIWWWLKPIPPAPPLAYGILMADEYFWWANGLGSRAEYFRNHPEDRKSVV